METFTLTKRKRTGKEKLAAYLLLFFTVFFLLATYFIILSFTVALVLGIIWYFVQFRRYFEFEVSYFDGDFKVVKIINKARRKKVIFFSIDDVIQIAPMGDRSVYKYENDSQVKVYDCYSLEEDAKPYDIIVKSEAKIRLVRVELDDKMLKEICKKNQQKVIC